MVTIKFPYTTSPDNKGSIQSYMTNQACVTKFIFNRFKESEINLSQKELTAHTNSMNHVNVDSWFKQSSVYEASSIYESYKKKVNAVNKYNQEHLGAKKKIPAVIFGGRDNFLKRNKQKISHEEFTDNRYLPLVSVGEALQKGNRKFSFKIIEENKILFKPEQGIKVDLQLPHLRKNYRKILFKLQNLMEQKKLPVKISLDSENICISYDENFLRESIYLPVKNRIMSIDMNPNYVGYSIVEYHTETVYKILKTGIVSIKKLNDKQLGFKKEKLPSTDPKNIKLNNQRKHEIFEITKTLNNIALSFNVEGFGLELINMKSSNKGKGSKYNRLVNNFWCRKDFENNLIKRLTITGIKVIGVNAAYTSFIGNMLYRKFPDMIAASIEINRRAYINLNKEPFAFFPSFTQNVGALTQSLEELGVEASKLILKVKSWKELYGKIKNLGLRYRVPLDPQKFKVFRLGRSPWVESFLSFSMF